MDAGADGAGSSGVGARVSGYVRSIALTHNASPAGDVPANARGASASRNFWLLGEKGLATRAEVVSAYNSLLDGDVETIISEMDERAPEERSRIERRKLRREIREIGEEMRQNEETGTS